MEFFPADVSWIHPRLAVVYLWHSTSAATWIKKLWQEVVQLSNRELQILDRADAGVQNFNFAIKFLQNGGFPARNLYFEKNFQQKDNFPTGENLGEGSIALCPSTTMLLLNTGRLTPLHIQRWWQLITDCVM